MPLKIKAIEPDSQAENAGLKAEDLILRINGIEIRDFLDFNIYASDYHLIVQYQTLSGELKETEIFREYNRSLGIVPADHRPRSCANNCIFCFIDQMPPNMRSSLYVKDDDYLYSLVYGNFITLTNLSEKDISRIKEQGISPLYISLHSTDKELRQKMMRSKKPLDAMQLLKDFADSGIQYHLQIVCVPGYNDKKALKKTLIDLMDEDLAVLSIGIVPVGLSKYRDGLCQLKGFDAQGAAALLDTVNEVSEAYGADFIYPADEFYILSGKKIPQDDFYNDYPQLENGIGLMRLGYQAFEKKKNKFLKELKKSDKSYLFITSKIAESFIAEVCQKLNKTLKRERLSYRVIKNEFFGESITVAGLITAEDILRQHQTDENQILVIPNCILNFEDETLDGLHISDLRQKLNREILLVDQLWESWERL